MKVVLGRPVRYGRKATQRCPRRHSGDLVKERTCSPMIITRNYPTALCFGDCPAGHMAGMRLRSPAHAGGLRGRSGQCLALRDRQAHGGAPAEARPRQGRANGKPTAACRGKPEAARLICNRDRRDHTVPTATASVGTLGALGIVCTVCALRLISTVQRVLRRAPREQPAAQVTEATEGTERRRLLLPRLAPLPPLDHLLPGGWHQGALVESTGAARCELELGHKTVQQAQQHCQCAG